MFRLSVDWPSTTVGLTNGWKLANPVHHSNELPVWCRVLWPVLVRKAGFVNRIIKPLDRSEPLETLQLRLIDEFCEFLASGPFLGEREEPSLADISLYPLTIFGNRMLLKHDTPWSDNKAVIEWGEKMKPYFDRVPYLTGRVR